MLFPPDDAEPRTRIFITKRMEQESGDPANLKPEEIMRIFSVLASPKPAPEWEFPGTPGLKDYMALRLAECARELGVRAWTFDFEGGPFTFWMEFNDLPEPFGGGAPGMKNAAFNIDTKSGRLLFWHLPGANLENQNPSTRNQRLMQLLKSGPNGAYSYPRIPMMYGFDVIPAKGDKRVYVAYAAGNYPKPPGLWTSWNDVTIREVSRTSPARITKEMTGYLLDAD